MGRSDAQALGLADRVALVEARLDLVDERIATSTRRPSAAEVRAETVRQHQRDVVVALTAIFLALVAAATALGLALVTGVTS